jgi:hypothetical protein
LLPIMTQKLSIPANPDDERGSKRRLRSIKRESRPAKEGPPIRAAQGQRKAIRGTRLRQRRT